MAITNKNFIKKEVVVGIDIGTSYIKGAVRDANGEIISVYRKQSSANLSEELINTMLWWKDVKSVMNGILSQFNNQHNHIVSMCVSAISPTLTVFDAKNPNEAYSILYSTLPKKKYQNSQYDSSLTETRLSVLRRVALEKQFVKPCITDLVGYINWKLTGELTINSISLSCLGAENTFNNNFLCVEDSIIPQIVSTIEKIGVTTELSLKELGINYGISVCGGCPDVMGSIVGSGMKSTEDRMIYLGTFGSLLKLEQEIDFLLESKIIEKQPFNWLLSVPEFGAKIEMLSKEWFNEIPRVLCEKANKVSAGCNGTVFYLPRWKNGMNTVGKYKFNSNSNEVGLNFKSRAVLESIAYAIQIIEKQLPQNIYVSGGGAQSQIWLDIISTVLRRRVLTLDYSWECAGTADIAGRMFWKATDNHRSIYKSNVEIDINNEILNNNFTKVEKYYYGNNWL